MLTLYVLRFQDYYFRRIISQTIILLMKKLLLLISFVLTGFAMNALDIDQPVATGLKISPSEFSDLPKELSTLSAEKLLTASPSEFKKMTGRKLSIKEVFALKSAQKAVKKSMNAATHEHGEKSQLVALLLAIFLGALGVHRFYLGYTGIGIIQLLTGGGCGIWFIIDIILIAVGSLGPKDGSGYDDSF